MKLYDGSLIIVAMVVAICVIIGSISTLFLGKDNPVEEVAEDVIEKETGIKVDLTPKILPE